MHGIYPGRFLRWSNVYYLPFLRKGWRKAERVFFVGNNTGKQLDLSGVKPKIYILYLCHSCLGNEMYLCMFLGVLYLDL